MQEFEFHLAVVESAAFFCDVSAFSDAQFPFSVWLHQDACVACQGRHRTSIDFFLTNEDFDFSYSALTGKITDEKLLPNLRSAFTRLLVTLYINRCEDTNVTQSRICFVCSGAGLSFRMVDREPYEKCDSIQQSRLQPGVVDVLGMNAPSHQDPFLYPDIDKKDKGSPLQYTNWSGGKEGRTGRVVERPNDDWLAAKNVVLTVLKSVKHIDPNDVDTTLFLVDIVNLAKVML